MSLFRRQRYPIAFRRRHNAVPKTMEVAMEVEEVEVMVEAVVVVVVAGVAVVAA